MKQCGRCRQEKPLADFHRYRSGKVASYCKPCRVDYNREWRSENRVLARAQKKRWEAAHPEEVRAAKRRRYQANLERSREQQKEWRKRNPEKIAARNAANRVKMRELGLYAFYRHGLTLDARRALEESQGHKCPFCDRPLAEVRVHVDHDHETGKVRGILCQPCNNRLGWYERRMDQVAAYLAKS